MLSTKNERIVKFYENRKDLDFEKMNIMLIDFMEKISSNADMNREDFLLSSFKKLETHVHDMRDTIKLSNQTMVNLQTTIANIPSNMSDNIGSKLSDIKENSVREIERVLETNKHHTTEHIDSKFKAIIIDNFKHILDVNLLEYKNTLENKNQSFELLDSINGNFQSRCDSLQQFILSIVKELQETTIKNSNILVTLNTNADRQKSANYKGIDSENKLESTLNDIFPEANIINTTGKPNCGDFWFEREGQDKIMIENKDHKVNITIPAIKDFMDHADYVGCHGILISHQSGIAKKKNFQIDIHNKHILIYIHNANYDKEKIRLAVDAIDHLSNSLKKYSNADEIELNITTDIIKEINTEYQVFLSKKIELSTTLTKFNATMKKQIAEIHFPELAKVLAQQFANTESTIFKCQYCKKTWKNAVSLAKHTQTCIKTAKVNEECLDASENSDDCNVKYTAHNEVNGYKNANTIKEEKMYSDTSSETSEKTIKNIRKKKASKDSSSSNDIYIKT